jgi:transcriptional regulator with GAF, ATPase, and Fis domain
VVVPEILDTASTTGMALEEVERNHILRALELAHWRVRAKNGAAAVLRLKPTTLESRMAKLGIERPGIP